MPTPGSSLLNPRSYRAKVRRVMATHQQQTSHFDAQALYADVGGSSRNHPSATKGARHNRQKNNSGSGEGGEMPNAVASSPPLLRRSAKSRSQRRGHHVRQVVGKDVAERVKCMTDAEWLSVPMEEKHAFTKYMGEVLREHPSEATEQQRRRYFETTVMDPRDVDHHRTVTDSFERVKLGLPVHLKHPQRPLGVSQAIFDSGDATLFDPANVDQLEEGMIQLKQAFADYVRQRREGISTEATRRRLANMMASLNVETQRHLSHMFKYAEETVRQAAMEERRHQLSELARLRSILSSPVAAKRKPTEAANDQAPSPQTADPFPATQTETVAGSPGDSPDAALASTISSFDAKSVKNKKKVILKRSLTKALGLDFDVVDSLITELEAQEKFMQFCEVFARLTVGRGFHHGAGDEGLDAYTESLRRLYSVDAQKLSTLDVVQYLAAKEETQPVDWARRWYERVLRIPLESTPEYRRLKGIQEEERAALCLKAELQNHQTPEESSVDPSATSSHSIAQQAEREVAVAREQGTIRLVEKMYMRPDDTRLQTLHEKRLRYIAYLQMERQIAQARENALLFDGVEDTPEAADCRELYKQLMARRSAAQPTSEGGKTEETDGHVARALSEERFNIFETDDEAAALFERISATTQEVIKRYKKELRMKSKAAEKAAAVKRVLQAVRDGGQATEMQALLRERRDAVVKRLFGVLEADVKSEMEWIEAMGDADRPPLLPVPEGMSYVSAAEVQAWADTREADAALDADPFRKKKKQFQARLFGQPWQLPDRPLLFWGTGTRAVQQALENVAEDAERRRRGEPLAPPYPCPENPWGWRLVKDILDD